jgi:hypothetical protein
MLDQVDRLADRRVLQRSLLPVLSPEPASERIGYYEMARKLNNTLIQVFWIIQVRLIPLPGCQFHTTQ